MEFEEQPFLFFTAFLMEVKKMDEFENRLIRGIHKSRYVASWTNSQGPIRRGGLFEGWLRMLTIDGEKLTEDEVQEIVYYATNGKLELQEHAKQFLRWAF